MVDVDNSLQRKSTRILFVPDPHSIGIDNPNFTRKSPDMLIGSRAPINVIVHYILQVILTQWLSLLTTLFKRALLILLSRPFTLGSSSNPVVDFWSSLIMAKA